MMDSQLANNLLITFVSIILVAITSCAILYLLHKYRHSLRPQSTSLLPSYHESNLVAPPKRSRHSRQSSVILTAKPPRGQRRFMKPLDIFTEKANAISDEKSGSQPGSPVPEIRVTLPEETDKEGKKTVPRVVIVHLNEEGEAMGMEPVMEELPPYQRFESVDLERVGGLKEKEAAT